MILKFTRISNKWRVVYSYGIIGQGTHWQTINLSLWVFQKLLRQKQLSTSIIFFLLITFLEIKKKINISFLSEIWKSISFQILVDAKKIRWIQSWNENKIARKKRKIGRRKWRLKEIGNHFLGSIYWYEEGERQAAWIAAYNSEGRIDRNMGSWLKSQFSGEKKSNMRVSPRRLILTVTWKLQKLQKRTTCHNVNEFSE